MVASLELRGVEVVYQRGPASVPVLLGVDLTVEVGEIVAIVGRSGSGKTTLLQVAGALAEPSAGSVRIAGHDVAGLDAAGRARLRRTTIGFVFQAFHLLPGMTVLENVAVPLALDGWRRAGAHAAALEVLVEVGLDHRLDHRPGELSGGEMQRVAVARALVNRPVLVLADEPTGNLDAASGEAVLDALLGRTRAHRAGCVLVTHDPGIAARADRRLALVDGKLGPVLVEVDA